jgi:hypothetical protein
MEEAEKGKKVEEFREKASTKRQSFFGIGQLLMRRMATGEMGNLTRGDGKKSLLERLFGGGGGAKAQQRKEKEEEEEANCAKLATLKEEEDVEEKEEGRRRQGHEECTVGPSCSREEQQAQGWPKDSYRRAQQEGPLHMDTVCVGGGGEGEGGEEERIRVRGNGKEP